MILNHTSRFFSFFVLCRSLCTLAFISMSNLLPNLSGVFIFFFLGAHIISELTKVTDFLFLNKVHQRRTTIGSKLWSECVYIKFLQSPATTTIGKQMWLIFHRNHSSYPHSSHKSCLHPYTLHIYGIKWVIPIDFILSQET